MYILAINSTRNLSISARASRSTSRTKYAIHRFCGGDPSAAAAAKSNKLLSSAGTAVPKAAATLALDKALLALSRQKLEDAVKCLFAREEFLNEKNHRKYIQSYNNNLDYHKCIWDKFHQFPLFQKIQTPLFLYNPNF